MGGRRDRVAVVRADPRRRWPRNLLIALAACALLFFGGGGWFYSGLIRNDALLVKEPEPEFDYRVVAATYESITLAIPDDPDDDLTSGEIMGVRWVSGYGRAGDIISRTGGEIGRSFRLISGELPQEDELVALEGDAYPPDPAQAGIAYETVTFASPFGEFEAWLFEGEGTTWAVYVHGRGSTRREGLRMLEALADHDLPTLLIEYRNDPGALATDDRLATFGVDERKDLEGALRYALANGADDVILAGASMGGAIVMNLLYNSDLAPSVRAVILDAPALELGAMVDARAGDTNLPILPIRVPMVLTSTAKAIAGFRFGVAWEAVDYLKRADEIEVPVLILHGADDDTVPIDLSRQLEDARPRLVDLVEFPGADHVRSWNVDRDRYLAEVGAFVDRVVPGG